MPYFGNVAQIEEIVNSGWCWQELLHDGVVHLDGCMCHNVADRLHFFLEILQLLIDHGAKDPLQIRLRRKRHVDEVETRLKPARDHHTAAARWAHGT